MIYGLPDAAHCSGGPAIVAVGGGTGLSTMLRGLKKYTDRLTAIVTVADDGGGSGMLRRDMGILPPGDVRQCMQALANTEPVMEQLLDYRFPEGQLRGQSFGNLLLAALNGITGSFEAAVAAMGQVLAISGRVLPVTEADVQLEAVFENGARVVGESRIFKKAAGLPHPPCPPSAGAPAGAAGRAARHRGGGSYPARPRQPVHQHHPQSPC